MEKQPFQKFRDDLADKLNGGRNSDEENPELARAKTQGYLEAKKETEEYQSTKKRHLNDVKDLLESKPDNIRKALNKIESELDRALKVTEYFKKGIEIPNDIANWAFGYFKKTLHGKQAEKILLRAIGDSYSAPQHPVSYFLENTGRIKEVIEIYGQIGTDISLAWAANLAEKARLFDIAIKLRKKDYENQVTKLQGAQKAIKKGGEIDIDQHQDDVTKASVKLGLLFEQSGLTEEAKKIWTGQNIYDKILEYALHDGDLELLQKVYNKHFSPEKIIDRLYRHGTPFNDSDTNLVRISFDGSGQDIFKSNFYDPGKRDIELLVKAATALGRRKDVGLWKELIEKKYKHSEEK